MPDPLPAPLPRRTLRTGEALVSEGLAQPERLAELEAVASRYQMAITPIMADLIDPSVSSDPIARQFVPSTAELERSGSEIDDPIGDLSHQPVKGIVHRYPDRVLLTPLLHCPLYCRFCFRRERVGGDDGALTDGELDAAASYIGEHPEIWEVVISGGDPLMLPPARIRGLMDRLSAIPHVAVIRFHSRVPVGDPARITPALIEALSSAKTIWLALHCNHPRELTPDARQALARLSRAGIPLVSQTVLLKGVNDDARTLDQLFRALVENRVKPYYLHHPDLAPGTGHFRGGIAEGQDLMRRLRGNLSGLCQPTYVLDIPGGHGKVPIGPVYWDEDGGEVTDPCGQRHVYPPA